MADAPVDSLGMLFEPDIAARFKCGISVLDSWVDILPMISLYLGRKELDTEPQTLAADLGHLRARQALHQKNQYARLLRSARARRAVPVHGVLGRRDVGAAPRRAIAHGRAH
jgi:hypothetical protein